MVDAGGESSSSPQSDAPTGEPKAMTSSRATADSNAVPKSESIEKVKFALIGIVVGAVLSGAFGLVGVSCTNQAQTQMQANQAEADRAQQQRQFEEERDTAARALRRPVYLDYLDKANAFANAHRERNRECRRGTDQPKRPTGACNVRLLIELQHARYEYKVAQNRLATVGTPAADAADRWMRQMMPSAASRANEIPYEGDIDEDGMDAAYWHFVKVTACDTAPTPVC